MVFKINVIGYQLDVGVDKTIASPLWFSTVKISGIGKICWVFKFDQETQLKPCQERPTFRF